MMKPGGMSVLYAQSLSSQDILVFFQWVSVLAMFQGGQDCPVVPNLVDSKISSLKLTAISRLKMDAWKTFSFPFGAQECLFSGVKFAVCFREGFWSAEETSDPFLVKNYSLAILHENDTFLGW